MGSCWVYIDSWDIGLAFFWQCSTYSRKLKWNLESSLDFAEFLVQLFNVDPYD